jgi:RNA polymerase sigma factor (TIGR02999 family)
MDETTSTITDLLRRWRAGDKAAEAAAVERLYDELRRLAASYLRRERPDHTLQTTALVHELYIQLSASQGLDWESRAHFMGVAARAMRQLLVDHARHRRAWKRGAGAAPVPLIEVLDRPALAAPAADPVDLLALEDALLQLEAIHPRVVRVVEARYFAGLSVQETADCLAVSSPTVDRDWAFGRAWLRSRLEVD